MKKIKWLDGYQGSTRAYVGAMVLESLSYPKSSYRPKRKYRAHVYLQGGGYSLSRIGSMRKTSQESQADAIRIAKEMLLDCQTCLSKEMKNFGLEE